MRHSPLELSVSAAEIVARRMPVILSGMVSPTAATHAEITRMVVEKQMALVETCLAVQAELFRMMLGPWTPASADRLMQAAIAPAARRVKANARRLRR